MKFLDLLLSLTALIALLIATYLLTTDQDISKSIDDLAKNRISIRSGRDQFFEFRDFPVYRAARRFRKLAKELSQKIPASEDYVLKPQLWRALDSIILNIAEGSERHSDLDFGHFLNNSLASTDETIACFDLAFDDGYISQEELDTIVREGKELGKQLNAFSGYLRSEKK